MEWSTRATDATALALHGPINKSPVAVTPFKCTWTTLESSIYIPITTFAACTAPPPSKAILIRTYSYHIPAYHLMDVVGG